MKVAYLLSVLLGCMIFGCDKDDVFCERNREAESIQDDSICMDSIRCGNEFNTYLCICDGMCMCFFKKTINCNPFIEQCDGPNSVLLFGKSFCKNMNLETIIDISRRVNEMNNEP
jgi:hypothetical protein